MDELDQFINQFYTKYNQPIPDGDRRVRLREKLQGDFDGVVTQMYQKYTSETPDSTRLANLRTKYWSAPKIDPRVQAAFAPQQKYKEFEKQYNDIYKTEVDSVEQFAEQRRAELSKLATKENLDSLNEQLKSEIDFQVGQANAKLKNEYDRLISPVEKALSTPLPDKIDKQRFNFGVGLPGMGVVSKSVRGFGGALGKSVATGLGGIVPQNIALLEAKSGKLSFEDLFDERRIGVALPADASQYKGNYERWNNKQPASIRFKPTREKLKLFFDTEYGPGAYETLKEDYTKQIADYRAGKIAEAALLKAAAAETLGDTAQSFTQIDSPQKLMEYIGFMGGQALYNIPLSVLTRGGSSYIMEAGAIYDAKLDKLSQDTGLPREEIVRQGLDEDSAAETLGALIAGGLDAVSAGNIIGAFKQAGGSKLKNWLINISIEGATESTQGITEEIASSVAAGRGATQDLFTKESGVKRIDELLGGVIGGGIIGPPAVSAGNIIGAFKQAAGSKLKNWLINTSIGGGIISSPAALSKTNELVNELPVDPQVAQQQDSDLVQTITDIKNAKTIRSNEGQVQEDNAPQESQGQSSSNLQQQTQEPTSNPQEQVTQADSRANPYREQINRLAKQEYGPDFVREAQKLIDQLSDGETKRELQAELILSKRGPKEMGNLINSLKNAAGVPKMISMQEKTALKDQIRNFARGIREGRLDEKKDRVNLIATIRDIIGKQQIGERAQKQILSKLQNLNFLNTDKVVSFVEFVDKVTQDATYADKLAALENLKSKVKARYKTRLPKPQQAIVRDLLKLDIEDAPKGYSEALADLAAHFKPVTDPGYAPPPSMERLQQIAEEGLATLREKKEARELEAQSFLEFDGDANAFLNDQVEFGALPEEKQKQIREQLSGGILERTKKLSSKRGVLFERFNRVFSGITPEVLSSLSGDDLKQLVRVLDQNIVNNTWAGAGELAIKLEFLAEKKNLPTIDRKVGLVAAWLGNLATTLNSLFNLDLNKASDHRAISGIQEFLDGDVVAGNDSFELLQKIQALKDKIEYKNSTDRLIDKGLGFMLNTDPIIDLESLENRNIAKTYSELIQRAMTMEEGTAFQNAKINIEQTIELLKKIDPELGAIKEAAYAPFKNATSRKEVKDIMAKTHPEIKQWVEGLTELFTELRDKGREVNEAVFGEGFVEIENYLPLGTKLKEGNQDITLEQARRDLLDRPHQAGSLKAREVQIGNNAYRTGAFLEDLVFTADQVLKNYHTAPAVIKLRTFLNEDLKENYKYTGGSEENGAAYRDFIKNKSLPPAMFATQIEKMINYGANGAARIAYTAALGGLTAPIKQYVPGFARALTDFGARGDISLLFGKEIGSDAAKKVRNLHTIGGRLKRLAGLTVDIQTERQLEKATLPFGKRLDKLRTSFVELTEKISEVSVGKLFGKADASLAERVWSGAYIQGLQKSGVEFESWENEYELRNEPSRKKAAAYAESYVGQNLLQSTGKEGLRALRSLPNMVKMLVPLVQYRINLAHRMYENWRVIMSGATKEEKKNAATSVTGDLVEIVTFDVLIRQFMLTPLQDYITDVYREAFTDLDEPDEEDKEKRDLFRKRYMIYNTIKNMVPLPILPVAETITGTALPDNINQVAYELTKEDDQDYADWLKENEGTPVPVFKSEEGYGIATTGAYGILFKTFGNDWHIEDDTLFYTDKNGVERSVNLSDEERSALDSQSLKVLLNFVGLTEFARAIQRVENEALKKAKKSKGTGGDLPIIRPYINRPNINKPQIK